MPVNSATEYGLRCVVQLGRAWPENLVSASVIAEREGLGVQYVSKLLHLLRKKGLIEAVRGQTGGFRLKKPPSEITLYEIVRVLDPDRHTSSFCSKFTGHESECVHLNECSVKPVWELIRGYFERILNEVTVEDLAGSPGESSSRIRGIFKAYSDELQVRSPSQGGHPL